MKTSAVWLGSALSGMANLCSAISDIQPTDSQRRGSRPGSLACLHIRILISLRGSAKVWSIYHLDEVPCCRADHQHDASEKEMQGRRHNFQGHKSFVALVINHRGYNDQSGLGKGSEGERPLEICNKSKCLHNRQPART